MNIVVLVKLVPDLVEELSIDESGIKLDDSWLRLIINEFDDHAIEQAIILKERSDAIVTIIAPEAEGVDDVLYTAAAKGADRIIKLTSDLDGEMNNHALAGALVNLLEEHSPDLVLTGVQANNDTDGQVGPILAALLGMPYVGYVAGITYADNKVIARKEYPGGLIAEMSVILPGVLGVQASEKPPRYVAVSKVRQTMKTATIDVIPVSELKNEGGATVNRLYQPDTGDRATMIDGDEEEIAGKLIEIFQELGAL